MASFNKLIWRSKSKLIRKFSWHLSQDHKNNFFFFCFKGPQILEMLQDTNNVSQSELLNFLLKTILTIKFGCKQALFLKVSSCSSPEAGLPPCPRKPTFHRNTTQCYFWNYCLIIAIFRELFKTQQLKSLLSKKYILLCFHKFLFHGGGEGLDFTFNHICLEIPQWREGL